MSACGTRASETTAIDNYCRSIPLQAYTPDFNARLADEVNHAAPGAVWPAVVGDYAGLRDAVKACASIH